MSKKKPWSYICGGAFFAIAALIFYFYDLNISLALYNPDSLLGHIVQIGGEWPNSICLILSSGVLFSLCGERKILSPQRIFYTFGCAVGWYALIFYTPQHAGLHIDAILGALLVALGLVVTLLLFSIANSDRLALYKDIALVALFMALSTIIVVNGIKVVWGRTRFYSMIDPAVQFTRWPFPQGITGHKSFPSGHTANAASSFILTLFVHKKSHWTKKALCYGLPVCYTAATALGRVIIGAHFASDVLFGAGITLILLCLYKKCFLHTGRSRLF